MTSTHFSNGSLAAPEMAGRGFDEIAPTYDDQFTHTLIGRHLRTAVQARLLARFQAHQRIFELNSGTGEDAVFLARHGISVLATDVAPRMIAIAQQKINEAGVADRVELRNMPIEKIEESIGQFDGVLSNFGGLNCVASLESLAARLADRIRPGGFAILCLMGPLVPWEWAWFLGHAQPRQAVRRLRRGGVTWRGVHVRYPSIDATTRAFDRWFIRRRVSALGCLVPPTYMESWATRHPRLLERLARLERRLETAWPLPQLADHYLVELERA